MTPDLARYAAMRTDVLNRIRRMLVVGLKLNCSPEDIDPDTSLFGTGLGIDSVDALEIVIGLDVEFGVKLTDPQRRIQAMRSVNALVDFVLAHSSEVPRVRD